MILSKITWRNLLSYGNYDTTVDFLKNDLTIIIGKNGVGKSTLLDALCFVLFGKPFRKINLPLLVNSTTKQGLMVDLRFSVGQESYKVVRCMKPVSLDI